MTEHGQLHAVEIEYEYEISRTDGAILLAIEGREVWLPVSQIIELDFDTVTIPEWLAMEEGLI